MRTTPYSLVAAATLALPGLLAAQSPLRLALPSARVQGGFVRTTDPIGAFGTTLRQRAVTPAAFDPARLNDPAPVNNMTGGLVLEVPVFNADALTGWRAARSAADAHDAMADWTAVNTRAMVVKAYYGAVLAEEKVAMLTQAKRAAESAVKQVESMVRQGLVTKADQLQASVRAGDIESQLLAARNDAITARQQLAMLLGRTDTALVALPTSLPGDSVVRAFARSTPMGSGERTAALTRDDVRAAQLGARAAAADRQRATATLLPRVNGFARYDYNSPTTLYGGRPNWTVGVMGSWSLFGGASELADVAGASARARSARAGDELLGAETAATGAALAEAAARYTFIDALAQHRRAIGADPGALAQLDGRHAASTNDVRNEDPTP